MFSKAAGPRGKKAGGPPAACTVCGERAMPPGNKCKYHNLIEEIQTVRGEVQTVRDEVQAVRRVVDDEKMFIPNRVARHGSACVEIHTYSPEIDEVGRSSGFKALVGAHGIIATAAHCMVLKCPCGGERPPETCTIITPAAYDTAKVLICPACNIRGWYLSTGTLAIGCQLPPSQAPHGYPATGNFNCWLGHAAGCGCPRKQIPEFTIVTTTGPLTVMLMQILVNVYQCSDKAAIPIDSAFFNSNIAYDTCILRLKFPFPAPALVPFTAAAAVQLVDLANGALGDRCCAISENNAVAATPVEIVHGEIVGAEGGWNDPTRLLCGAPAVPGISGALNVNHNGFLGITSANSYNKMVIIPGTRVARLATLACGLVWGQQFLLPAAAAAAGAAPPPPPPPPVNVFVRRDNTPVAALKAVQLTL